MFAMSQQAVRWSQPAQSCTDEHGLVVDPLHCQKHLPPLSPSVCQSCHSIEPNLSAIGSAQFGQGPGQWCVHARQQAGHCGCNTARGKLLSPSVSVLQIVLPVLLPWGQASCDVSGPTTCTYVMNTGLSLDRSLRHCLDCPHVFYRLAVWMEHRFSGTQHMTQNAAGVACSFLSLRNGRPLTISMNLHKSGQVR